MCPHAVQIRACADRFAQSSPSNVGPVVLRRALPVWKFFRRSGGIALVFPQPLRNAAYRHRHRPLELFDEAHQSAFQMIGRYL